MSASARASVLTPEQVAEMQSLAAEVGPEILAEALIQMGYPRVFMARQARTLMAEFGVLGWHAQRRHEIPIATVAQELCDGIEKGKE